VRRRHVLAVLSVGLLALSACGSSTSSLGFGDCGITSAKGSLGDFKLTKGGVLTVATNLPAPGYWGGTKPDNQKDGLEFCMAADIASRLGLSKVSVKQVDFAALQAGQVQGFDIAMSQITVNAARKQVVDFSNPYFTSDQALMVLKGTAPKTLADIQALQLGSQSGTTALEYIDKNIKPQKASKVFQDTPSMFNALLAKTVDGIVFDTAILLPQSKQAGYENTALVAQFKTGEGYGILLPKGSKNVAKVNELLAAMKADGSLDRFSQKYVAVALSDVANIPFIDVPS
jgi:polar amino acid transport system substrate-binding protein